MMPVDKIRPFHDPRVQYRSAHLNGHTYGYLYSPAATSTPHRGTIVLVHGFPDLSFGWRYQIPFLTSIGLDVVAIDSMGYGRTDSPRYTLADYSFKRAADDIAELCRQLGLPHILLGGHDWGGAIVYRVVQYYPGLITAFFSICTPYFPPNPEYEPLGTLVQKRLPNFRYQLHFASGEIEAAVQSKAEIRQFLSNLYGARTPDRQVAFDAEKGVDLALQPHVGTSKLLSDEEMDYYVQEYSRHGINGPLNWYRTREVNYLDEWVHFFGTDGQINHVPKIEHELLFVLATRDQAIKPFMAEKMRERVPNLTRKEVQTGHWALWEKPDECNRIIGDWLEEKVFADGGKGLKSRL